MPPQEKKMSVKSTEAKIFACTQSQKIGEEIAKAYGTKLGKISF